MVLHPDWPRDRPEWQQYEEYLKEWLGVPAVQVLRAQLLPIMALAALGVITIWPAWRTARKAGFSGLFLICSALPIVNWFTLALAEWPIEREVKRVKANAN